MTEQPSNLETRVTSLEQQMTVVSAESKAALALATAVDRDVSVIRDQLNGQTRVLNALRQTQLEQGETLRDHGERIGRLETEMRSGFATVGTGMAHIVTLLESIGASAPE